MSELNTKLMKSETLVLAEHLGDYAASQPCSGTVIVAPHSFSPGAGTASPVVVVATKTAA